MKKTVSRLVGLLVLLPLLVLAGAPRATADDDDPASDPSYRFLWEQKMERPYATSWYGKLLSRSQLGIADIRVQAVGKIVYDAVLRLNCGSGLHGWRFVTDRGRTHYAPGEASRIIAAARGAFCGTPPRARLRAAERRCASRQNFRSRAGGDGITITFVNQSGAFRSISWLDYQSQAKVYATLPNGRRYTVRTGIGHPWLITDRAGRCREIHLPRLGRNTIRLLPSSR